MSVQAMTWALEQQIVTEPHARHVLLCLANYADKQGRAAFPSVTSLSLDTGLAARTIQYRLRDLEKEGLIRKGNQAVAAAYIPHRDRVPVCYDLAMERGACGAPGACQNTTGCTPEHNGVHATTQRGAQHAPNPSINHQLTVNEPICDQYGFDDFWKRYPKKVQKKDARKAWEKINPDTELFNRILSSLDKHCVSQDWVKSNGQFIPNAATWLNGERWEDEVKPVSAQRTSSYVGLPVHTQEQYEEAADGSPNF